ncbi:LptF/LptG family permease [Campylobacter mucosalis]|uniref:LptF/LptG family permease n=1 Tax=Campylobacter mucosalis TaxID=202 RepID=UPI0014704818|nr:LptF/LptG family permease [Campylobacter mucosalis]
MNLYARYVGWVYFKSFLVVFLSLLLFYVGIDLLSNLKDIPSSANTQILYFLITCVSAVSYVLPISLVFALIVAKINMVRSNELVSFYALGVSKNALIRPPFFIALLITIFYVGLNFTPFAYAYDYQKSLIKDRDFNKITNDTLVKFDGKFVYIKELNPLENKILSVDIFDINETTLKSVTSIDMAKFKDNQWYANETNTTYLPDKIELGKAGLTLESGKNEVALSGFKPKSIQSANVADKSSLSVVDVLDFIFTFKDEGIELNSARSMFYSLTIYPFFAPLLVLVLYYYLPVTGRFFNLAFVSFILVLVTLVLWGVLFVLIKFSQSATILPEIGILLPIFALFCYSIYLTKAHH